MGDVGANTQDTLKAPREVHRSLDGMTVYLLVLLQENPGVERYQTALIALDASKAPDFIKRYGGKPVDLEEDAIVLWQGDGDYPPENVRQWMKERFGVTL